MRKLLNTLYITSEDLFLSLENSNVLIRKGNETLQRFPLHTLESIVTSSRKGISVPLLAECMRYNVSVYFLTSHGNLLARVDSPSAKCMDLRRLQFRLTDSPYRSLPYA